MINMNKLKLTPDKSELIIKNGVIKVILKNKIGIVKKRSQCSTCKYKGKVRLDASNILFDCCEVYPDGWRAFKETTTYSCGSYERR